MISPLHDIKDSHELLAVLKAMKALKNEVYFGDVEYSIIEKYLHYLYSIGFHQGMRTKAPTRMVYQFTLDGDYVDKHDSAVQASLKLGVHKGTISNAIRRGFNCKGFLFSYKKAPDTTTGALQ